MAQMLGMALSPNSAIPLGKRRQSAQDKLVHAAGVLLTTPDDKVLFVKRSAIGDHPGEWSIPGGKVELGETPLAAVIRELREETGFVLKERERLPEEIDHSANPEGIDYRTYRVSIRRACTPKLNEEHTSYMWAPVDAPPSPLHPGLAKTLSKIALDEMAANTASKRQLRDTIKYPPEPLLGGNHRAINESFSRGGVRGALKESSKARRFNTTTMDAFYSRKLGAADDWKESDYFPATGMLGQGDTDKEPEPAKPSSEEVQESVADVGKDTAKLSHEAVDFRPAKGRDRCGTCKAFRGENECEKVVAPLDANDWCAVGVSKVDGHRYDKRGEAIEARLAGDDRLAFDRASVREKTQDGHLIVEITNISKANICPYIGREIPGYEQLKLNPNQVYQLLRDPVELKKAADTFNNLPLLSKHVPVFAEDYAETSKQFVVGTTGSDAVFQAPYLRNSLRVWDGDAISRIEAGEQKEISCGYHYDPDMTPGTHEGQRYDGVMRNIHGNHVALVKEGRAGADVAVGE